MIITVMHSSLQTGVLRLANCNLSNRQCSEGVTVQLDQLQLTQYVQEQHLLLQPARADNMPCQWLEAGRLILPAITAELQIREPYDLSTEQVCVRVCVCVCACVCVCLCVCVCEREREREREGVRERKRGGGGGIEGDGSGITVSAMKFTILRSNFIFHMIFFQFCTFHSTFTLFYWIFALLLVIV